jgi:uncharacterized membrane protein (DUF4010 family)
MQRLFGEMPMRILSVFACVALIGTLGYVEVPWGIAGVGLCVCATIALVVCSLRFGGSPSDL